MANHFNELTGTRPLSLLKVLGAAGSSGRISLSWSAPASNGSTPILGYYIYRGTSSTNESFYSSVAGTSYSDSSVSLGTTYYYKVAAFNAGGFQSSTSSEANAKPASPTPLTPASLLLPAPATATIPILRRGKIGQYRRV